MVKQQQPNFERFSEDEDSSLKRNASWSSLWLICGVLCCSHASFVTNTNTELVTLLPKALFPGNCEIKFIITFCVYFALQDSL